MIHWYVVGRRSDWRYTEFKFCNIRRFPPYILDMKILHSSTFKMETWFRNNYGKFCISSKGIPQPISFFFLFIITSKPFPIKFFKHGLTPNSWLGSHQQLEKPNSWLSRSRISRMRSKKRVGEDFFFSSWFSLFLWCHTIILSRCINASHLICSSYAIMINHHKFIYL